MKISERLAALAKERILVLDGAMGTQIQALGLTEDEFRRGLPGDITTRQFGNNDLLVLSCPDDIAAIHRRYLEAGADIIETNTFNAQKVSQAEYGTERFVWDINVAAARIARAEADRMTAITPDKPRFVAGSVGPTGKTLSMSPDVESPASRAVDFDTLCDAYMEQMDALIEGGVDVLLIETIFDTLNAKAAIEAANKLFVRRGVSLPLMLSVTIADAAGRMLSGQTTDAFLASIAHAGAFSVGLNCSFGADRMLPFLQRLAAAAPCLVSAYPNAGLPDAMGCYDQTPEMMAESIRVFADSRLVNIVGGCCGSTPEHIRAVAEAVAHCVEVRKPPKREVAWLAGLEPFDAVGAFVNVGERCNVAGSRKFLRLVSEKKYDEALDIARKQVRDGAMMLDVNMDDAMLDSSAEMVEFVNLMASDPEVARVPWMIDSSRFDVVEAALKCIQGKAVVNSISLKEGEKMFVSRARRVRELGAAVVVMAFDEQGQAITFERKIEVCARAYRLLTEKAGLDPRDIIFDPNILTIATGMKEHDRYALDFICATRWIHDNLPGAKVSGGVSNLSFAFRGNNYLREAMHAVFLFHAIKAGLDMAIVNPSAKVMYSDIPQRLLDALEDTILCRRDDAAERLLAIAADYSDQKTVEEDVTADRDVMPVGERLADALKNGDDDFLEADIEEALAVYGSPQAIIEGPLMRGMSLVGKLFGEGKMFLPQVVKTARTMKKAVAVLQPHIMADRKPGESGKNGNYLLATVKGDVHDIGKNIAAVVLSCNNFNVIDLGVMVEADTIVKAARDHKAEFISLSGLITPSLDEMCVVASALREAGICVPLFIGGATTSEVHTAVKIAPLYDGPVFHVKDASQNPVLAMLLSGDARKQTIACLRHEQEQLRRKVRRTVGAALSAEKAFSLRHKVEWNKDMLVKPAFDGLRQIDDISINTVREFINWTHFYNLWGVRKGTPEADGMREEAENFLDLLAMRHALNAQVGFYEAYGNGTAIVVMPSGVGGSISISTPRQLQPGVDGMCRALCDYVAPEGMHDHIGVFAVTVSASFVECLEKLKGEGDVYKSLLMQSLGDRLVEAASEWLHARVRSALWGYAPDERLTASDMFAARYRGIRPAVGYPSLPDQSTIYTLSGLLDFGALGIRLTENGAMYPQASVCGLYIACPQASYFMV